MGRKRFDDFWRFIRFGIQSKIRPESMSSERYCWLLVDEFVKNSNDHRATMIVPSDRICVDESISRWYGQGGEWINHGLPMYVAIDRKPEYRCEIQSAACGRSGIMLRLKIVKAAAELQAAREAGAQATGLLHGTEVLLSLLKPWYHTNRICADSYFASVGVAEELERRHLRFIGVKSQDCNPQVPHGKPLIIGDAGTR